MTTPWRLPTWIVLGCAGLCGCTHAARRAPDPRASVTALELALQRDDAAAAYALLSSEQRASVDQADFERLWQDTAEERRELLEELRSTDGQLHARASVTFADGEEVGLVLQSGRWCIEAGVMDAASLRTPEDSVRALRRALQRKSLDGVLRVLSAERRAAWQAAFEAAVENTADSAALSVEVRGDTAEVRTPGGSVIMLVREAGEWHVTDVR